MTLDELNAMTITRPVRMKDCVICGDVPPDDAAIVAAGTVCLCERHEARMHQRLAGPPTTAADLVHRIFGPIV